MELANAPKDKLAQVRDLLGRTNKQNPNAEDVKALRKALAETPDLWKIGGDLAQQSQARILEDTPITPAAKAMVEAALDAMRIELGYQEGSMLERMMIEQVLLSWLRLNIIEYQASAFVTDGMTQGSVTFWEKRLSAAQRQFLRACETLERVRRLARNNPALQLNIATEGGQQVNISGDFVKAS